MKCSKVEKLISKLMDGRLEPALSARLEEHVKTCPSCAQLLEEYRSLKNALAGLKMQEAEPLPWFEQRLLARLGAESRQPIWAMVERWYAAAVPVFLVVAMVLVGILFLVQPAEVQVSQPQMLLLQGQNPLTEASYIFEAQKPEERQLQLLFAGVESQEILRRGKQ
ncbi:MAG: zf-HC2 domain-containing protein [Candidatus Saccharicenans sp.]|nr:zf-HC2 domain-containing protein [Candidatus Saccharicenans sp.]